MVWNLKKRWILCAMSPPYHTCILKVYFHILLQQMKVISVLPETNYNASWAYSISSDSAGYEIPIPHICNSAGLVNLPEAHLAAVRPGILIYGMTPSSDTHPQFPLLPALTLKSTVIHVRDLPPGSTISYGRTFTTRVPIRVALVSLGYGDGYPRLISNRGEVLIHGQRAPIRGRICMDQFVVEVTHIDNVVVGDEVVAIGRQSTKSLHLRKWQIGLIQSTTKSRLVCYPRSCVPIS